MEWNELPAAAEAGHLTGEEAVLNLVPDAYKKRRSWQPDQNLMWKYSKAFEDSNGEDGLVVVGYTPPILQTKLPEEMEDKLLASLEKQKLDAAEKGGQVSGDISSESKANKDGAAEAIFADPPFKQNMVLEAAKAHGAKVKREREEKEELLTNLKIQNASGGKNYSRGNWT